LKTILLSAAAVGLFAMLPSVAAAGEKLDMAELTCKQFLADEQGLLPTAFWIDGYLSHASGNTVIDPDELVENVKTVAESCAGSPDTKIIDLLQTDD
jgi:hypothetical protein